MDETLLKLRILTRAEVTLARVHGRVLARRILLAVLAVGALLLTIGMLNLGSFELLEALYGGGPAAFIIAGVNGALATVLLIVASRMKPGPEEQMIHEIRDLALSELSADAEVIKQSIDEVTSDIERIRSTIGSFTDTATAGLGSLTPVVGLVIEALKRRGG